jgi:hypothetical protein
MFSLWTISSFSAGIALVNVAFVLSLTSHRSVAGASSSRESSDFWDTVIVAGIFLGGCDFE